MTKSLNLFPPKIVWSIKRWPELSAKKDYLSLSPASNLSQKIPLTSIHTHTLPPTPKQELTPRFPLALVLNVSSHFSSITSFLLSLFLFLSLSLCHSISAMLSFLLVLYPVILARESFICIISICLICCPGSNEEGSLLPACLMVERALQASSSSVGQGLPGGLDEIS